MNYFATHARGMGAMETRLGADCPVVTWAGQDWRVLPGSAVRRKELGEGGFALDADLRFDAVVAQFLSATIVNAMGLERAMTQTEVGYLGRRYKVTAVHVAPGGLVVRVECNALGQGA